MEIDITTFFNDADAFDYSASIAERGQSAGADTWHNAVDRAHRKPMLTTEAQLDALREYVRDFGAWDDETIDAWSADECNALFIQLVSGDMREIESLCTDDDGEVNWTEYERLAQRGTISGNVFKASDGTIYYELSH
jgi:hypothetical protein